MQEVEIIDSIQTCVDVFLGNVVFVALDVGNRGCILIVGISCESFWPEVVFVWLLLEDLTEWVHDARRTLTEV